MIKNEYLVNMCQSCHIIFIKQTYKTQIVLKTPKFQNRDKQNVTWTKEL